MLSVGAVKYNYLFLNACYIFHDFKSTRHTIKETQRIKSSIFAFIRNQKNYLHHEYGYRRLYFIFLILIIEFNFVFLFWGLNAYNSLDTIFIVKIKSYLHQLIVKLKIS